MLSRVLKVLVAFAPTVLAVQRKIAVAENGEEVVGTASEYIDGSKESCRNDECSYGVLLCTALRSYGQREGKGTQIALYNGGGIRGSLRQGPVTKEELLKIHPYGNNVWFLKLKGDVIKAALRMALNEHGAPNQGEAGSWLQIAGMRFKAVWDGEKKSWGLSDIAVNTEGEAWEVLIENKVYDIVTNTYIVEGNGGRNIIKNGAIGNPQKDDLSVADLMINYFKNNSPVAPPDDDGRETLIIAEVKSEIDGSKELCRDRACPYGILLTETMLRYGKQNGHGSQIALYNGGGIRGSIPEGEIEEAEIRRVHPFGNNVEFIEVKGETIKAAIEMSLKEHKGPAKGESGSWFQIAGLAFKAVWSGSDWDLQNVTVQADGNAWSRLFNDVTYKVVTNTYIIDGNGGRSIIKKGIIGEVVKDETIASLMIDHFASSGPVSPPHADERELLVVGVAGDKIDGERDSCRDHSCAYGILLTNTLKEFGKQEGFQTQIGMYNSGGIRASIPKGTVTETEIFAVHPFGNVVWFAQVLGETIQQEIEMALEEHKGPGKGREGSWLQVTGLNFSAVWGGSSWTLSDVMVNTQGNKWEDIMPKTIYKIALNTYMMDGNGGRDIIKNNVLSFTRTEKTIAELMIDHFARNSPVFAPKIDDRVFLE